MRIYYDDPQLRHIHVDRERLIAFLREQNVSEQDIKRLCIRFRDQMPEGCSSDAPAEKILGSYNTRCSVYVCARERVNKILLLNRTLLHELRHYMKGGYQPGEIEITYWNRPSEVDARAFAEQHYKTQVFLYLDGVPDEPLPSPIAPIHPTPAPTRSSTDAGAILVAACCTVFLLKSLWKAVKQ